MSSTQTATQPLQIVTFGPGRAIGVRYEGTNPSGEIAALWQQFVPRLCGELAPLMQGGCLGVCRCVLGKTDGTFEYIAAGWAKPGAEAPDGMVAVDIPACDYAVFPVSELDQCQTAWQSVPAKLAESQEWAAFCTGPETCQCATHPCFEYYPPEYRGCGPFSIYIPVKRKTA